MESEAGGLFGVLKTDPCRREGMKMRVDRGKRWLPHGGSDARWVSGLPQVRLRGPGLLTSISCWIWTPPGRSTTLGQEAALCS